MLSDTQAILAHSLPVGHAVNAVQVEDESPLGSACHLLKIGFTGAGHQFSARLTQKQFRYAARTRRAIVHGARY
jgi:hypothetical protein